MEFELSDEQQTAALGAWLAPSLLAAGCGVVYLRGALGAGKTCVARGLLRTAGAHGALRSPTYTLVEPYLLGGIEFLHLDLYRLGDGSEVETLGIRDYAPDACVWIVEWPERGSGYLPPPDLQIDLLHTSVGRRVRLDWSQASGLERPTINFR